MPSGKQVAVVTDSTADLPRELVAQHNLEIIPLNLVLGGQTYRDGVDMDSTTFFQRLRSEREFPTTSQPSPAAFLEGWQRAAPDPAMPILSIHISSTLSGTVASAEAARKMIGGRTIEIVDTYSASLGQGLIVLAAARAAEAGQSLEECTAIARALIPRVHILLTVDTLEYLHRGGRIGGAARLLGTMLNLKPLLDLAEGRGRIEPLARIRTRAKAIDRMLEIAQERIAGRPAHIAALHTADPDECARLAERVRGLFDCRELILGQVGAAIGAHVGPGTLGMGFYTE